MPNKALQGTRRKRRVPELYVRRTNRMVNEVTEGIDPMFINHAVDVLADTSGGLSGTNIIAVTTAYAVEHGIKIPHQQYPFEAGNKRTALRENLQAFPPRLQFEIIRALCEHPQVTERSPEAARKLKIQLLTRYGHLAPDPVATDVSKELVEETRHWLGSFPENQISPLGDYVRGKGGSPEFGNMFVKLVEYFTKYQNRYVKHNDGVIEDEVEFIIEITSPHVVRLSGR